MSKKAVSEMIAYVLMIVIAISVSVLVYSFLRGIKPSVGDDCPEDTSLVIEHYNCYNHILNITLKNQGFHIIDGFMAYISNSTSRPANLPLVELGKEDLDGTIFFGPTLNTSQSRNLFFDYSKYGTILKIELKPFKAAKTLQICSTVTSQEIVGC